MILFISHYAGRTGAPIALLHLVGWLKQNTDLEFDILFKVDGELVHEFAKIAPTYICATKSKRRLFRRSSELKFSLELPKSIRKKQYDLIYSNTIANGILVASMFNDDIPLITHCHEMNYWMNKLENEMIYTISRTTEFIACSNPSANCLVKRGIDSNNIQVIPEPFIKASSTTSSLNRHNLRAELGIPDDSFVVLSGGEDPWRKGKDLFVQLAILLNNIKDKRFDLIWLGDHTDAEFEYWLAASADYANISEFIHWPGLVRNPLNYFDISNIFCMLSREDPMPLIAIEAASTGLPVLCFESAGGTADWVHDSAGGRVLPYLDVGSVAGVIREYAADKQVCIADGNRAMNYCSDHFPIDRIGGQIFNVIAKYLPLSA